MIVAVDTCILLDILKKDKAFFQDSYNKLNDALKNGKLIICEVIAAELATQLESSKFLEKFLSDARIEIIPSGIDSLFLAGQRYIQYLANRKITCPSCDKLLDLNCVHCQSKIMIRQHILPDFIIGAHALKEANILLTRDRGYYKSYFPELNIL